jgi:hypothetical protein
MRDINSVSQQEFTKWMQEPENGKFITLIYQWAMAKAYLIDEESILCLLKGVILIFLEAQKALEKPDYDSEVKWQ